VLLRLYKRWVLNVAFSSEDYDFLAQNSNPTIHKYFNLFLHTVFLVGLPIYSLSWGYLITATFYAFFIFIGCIQLYSTVLLWIYIKKRCIKTKTVTEKRKIKILVKKLLYLFPLNTVIYQWNNCLFFAST
jgi:hypothetical protein